MFPALMKRLSNSRQVARVLGGIAPWLLVLALVAGCDPDSDPREATAPITDAIEFRSRRASDSTDAAHYRSTHDPDARSHQSAHR